jgi:hypothetical protein
MKDLLRVGMVLLLAGIIAGCSKSSNNGGTAPELVAPVFAGPDSDITAAPCYAAYLADSCAMAFNVPAAQYLSLLSGLNGSQSGGTWSWTGTKNGVTVTWTATPASEGYNWKLVENGPSAGITFDNWTALSGYETTDGKNGSWMLYYPNTSSPLDSVSWSTATSGVLSGTVFVYNPLQGTVAETLEFTNDKANKSGELKIYLGAPSAASRVWDITWTASGGTWTQSYGGVTLNTGQW